MRIFEPTMAQQIDILLNLLLVASRESQPVNMSDRLEYLSGDIIGFLSFGHSLDLQVSRTNRFIVEGMLAFNHVVNILMQWFRLQQLGISYALSIFTRSTQERYRTFLEKIIRIRTPEPPDIRHDLYSVASSVDADATELGDGIRTSDIWSEAFAFFPASSFLTTPSRQSWPFI
jgi:hypothetical protein